MIEIELPNLLWYGNETREIGFPDDWDVEVLEPTGFRKPAISDQGIREAFENPIGSPALEEIAEGGGEAVIVFDDITRPTPVSVVIPRVLESLHRAGIASGNIRFMPALGMHGAMHNIDFRKKLGDGVVRGYPVFNHNPYENCTDLGKSPSGIPVLLNREFMSCDVRIGIGGITPHFQVGYGGGGKIILPGICGAETIKAFHKEVFMRAPETLGLGRFEGNAMYREIVDVVRMSGLQFKVDALINRRGEITDLFVGDPVQEHMAGVELAREHYRTRSCPGRDVVVANAYAKYNEMAICMLMALSTVSFDGGTIVLVVDAPEGQVCHYLIRSFGKDFGGECYIPRGAPPEGVKVVVCSRYPDRTMCDLFASPESVSVATGWDETLELLKRDYPEGASVAVIPDGTMQYFEG